PTASHIWKELSRWYNILRWCNICHNATNDDESAILKAFQSADEFIPILSTKSQIYSKDKLSSKLLNFCK
ncbi:3440_t:CDS:1, partial [Racocetra persica]